MIVSINPSTSAEIARFNAHSAAEVDAALTGAVQAQSAWRQVSIGQRVELLRAIGRVLCASKAEYVAVVTQKMGKPIPESEGEIEECGWSRDFYADAAPGYLRHQQIGSSATESGWSRITRRGAGHHALELSVLAVHPLRRSGFRGGERGHPEARRQRLPVCGRCRRGSSQGRGARKPVPHPADRGR